MMPGPRYTPHAQVTAHPCTSAHRFVNYRATQLRNPGSRTTPTTRSSTEATTVEPLPVLSVEPEDRRNPKTKPLDEAHGDEARHGFVHIGVWGHVSP